MIGKMTESGLYLGRRFDPRQLHLPSDEMTLGSPYDFSPYDLLTHAIILGMTGSGKTILGKIIVEETALQGVPAILIDPKGDLASMKLVFPSLKNESFIPWIEARKGEDKEQAASSLSQLYEKRLAGFDIPHERLEEFIQRTRVVILTPRSSTGIPLAISSLPSPPANVNALLEIEPETVLGLIDTVARTLVMRLFPNEPPEKHRKEEKFLNAIIRHAWEDQIPLEGIEGLATLVDLVEKPPMKKIGVMSVDSYISPKDRHELAVSINNLLVGVEQLWHIGIPLDIDFILDAYSKDGKTPIVIISLGEISSQEDRIFVVSRIAYAVYEWMRRKGGAGEPRLLFYIDEIGGGGGKTAFFPIHPYNPPSKPPLMLLVKQARAFGVCCVFSTQNPGDIDYKGLSNCGTWVIGRLSTARDREKVLQGLGDIELFGAAVDRRKLEKQIASLETGEFICKTKHGDVEFFKERWLMSYHKTLTAKEIRKLTDERDRKSPTTTILSGTAKRAFLKCNHPASLKEIRKHFREGIDIHVEKAECNYMPILSCRIKTGFWKRHPFLSREIGTDVAYGPILVPLFKNETDLKYADKALGLGEIREDDLLDSMEDTAINIGSKKLPIHDVFAELPKILGKEIRKEIADDLDAQIEKEKERAVESERLSFQPKLDELDFDMRKVNDQIADIKGRISLIERELANLRNDRNQRRRWGEPTTMVTKSINSRESKINKSRARTTRLQSKIKTLDSQKKRVLDSQNRKITLIEGQFKSVRTEILGELAPKLDFQDVVEIYVPICNANIRLGEGQKKRDIQLEWNGYNGATTTSFTCSECERPVDKFSALNVCYVCLEFLCEAHSGICAECGRVVCKTHSWRCNCGHVHCVSEQRIECQTCGAFLCAECRNTCEICGDDLCANHIYSCAICGRNVCRQHSGTCASCNRTLCREEKTYICSVGNHLVCEDCKLSCELCGETVCQEHSIKCGSCGKIFCKKPDHFKTCTVCGRPLCSSCVVTCEGCKKPLCSEHCVNCPNCNSTICEDCVRIERKFLGLGKKQKCAICT